MNRSELANKYIERRFPEAGTYYKDHWRDRFARGEEWNYSDFGGRRILSELQPNWYPSDIKAFKVLPPFSDQAYFIVCMTCGQTVSKINTDGECLNCENEAEANRN